MIALLHHSLLSSISPSLKTTKLKPLSSKTPVVLIATGSFSPITNFHLAMMQKAKERIEKESFEVVGGFLSPVNDAYDKPGLLSATHRCAMVELAVADCSWLNITSWEAAQPQYKRTIEVIHQLRTELAQWYKKPVRVMWVCGADLLESFNTPGLWSAADQASLAGPNCGIIVVPRSGSFINVAIWHNEILYPRRHTIFTSEPVTHDEASATELRKLIDENRSITGLTSEPVATYIHNNHLYAK